MSEWVSAVIGLVGIALGAGITWAKFRIDRRERFRVMTFEKRLEAHQAAYSHVRKLGDALNVGNNGDTFKVKEEALHWWYDNCLLLDNESRENLFGLVKRVEDYLIGDKRGKEVWSELQNARKAIVKGIGAEYLPEDSSTPQELKDTM